MSRLEVTINKSARQKFRRGQGNKQGTSQTTTHTETNHCGKTSYENYTDRTQQKAHPHIERTLPCKTLHRLPTIHTYYRSTPHTKLTDSNGFCVLAGSLFACFLCQASSHYNILLCSVVGHALPFWWWCRPPCCRPAIIIFRSLLLFFKLAFFV